MNITTGNARADGSEFRYWFVGSIEKWCGENNIPFDTERFGLRNTGSLEMKWGIYKKGDVRPEWAACSDMTGMSILIRGDSTFFFREKSGRGNSREVRLTKEGDYVIWTEDLEHSWEMLEDSVFLTIRWKTR